MPKFIVTTDEGKSAEPVRESMEFPTEKAATDDAQIALSEMAREKLPNGSHADFHVKVADEAGEQIYQASLTFDAQTAEDARKAEEEKAAVEDKAADEIAAAIRTMGTGPKL
ncbi:DUF6894 family protein [Bosea sp. PAMC 26642]|uniref:DUF6894 family protein n=1 Tax=Bosea sp. (strain PAMC 26642) TaxID=1792307 RepID=UPI0007705A0C|nr:hypothetical protein [Bosea sp. PAMC 26642]AMJ62926.1 hypothetical protein AXW83_23830 [Bosea sp. PAMC 26642]